MIRFLPTGPLGQREFVRFGGLCLFAVKEIRTALPSGAPFFPLTTPPMFGLIHYARVVFVAPS